MAAKIKKNANARNLTLATAVEQITALHEQWLTPATRATPGALLDILSSGIHDRVVEKIPELVTVTHHIYWRGVPHPEFTKKAYPSVERARTAAKLWVREMVWRIFTCDITDVERDHQGIGELSAEQVVDQIHDRRDHFLWERAEAVPCTMAYFSDNLYFPSLLENGTITFVERRTGGRDQLTPSNAIPA